MIKIELDDGDLAVAVGVLRLFCWLPFRMEREFVPQVVVEAAVAALVGFTLLRRVNGPNRRCCSKRIIISGCTIVVSKDMLNEMFSHFPLKLN